MPTPLKVDIWSDIACPWCYIGKRKFEAAVEQFGADKVEIEYHSYELTPDIPEGFEGSTQDFFEKYKGVSRDQSAQMLARVTDIAAEVGLNYDFDKVLITKTLLAHELLHFAKAHGKQGEMKERLLKAYFLEGASVGKIDVLVQLATEIGLDEAETRSALESHAHAPAVAEDIALAQQLGIQGVPFFVFQNKYGVSGAQPTETFLQVLEQVRSEEQTA